jgi:hypothetical protein
LIDADDGSNEFDLQLKKLKIDNDSNTDPNDVINGQGYVITDRNELLKKLGQKN